MEADSMLCGQGRPNHAFSSVVSPLNVCLKISKIKTFMKNMNQNEVYEIYIPKEALRNENRVLYLIKFIQEKKYYVGVTGTSNNSGVSSPLERLSKHIFPVGKTYSVVKSKNLNLENTDVRFQFIILEENEVKGAEKWLIWKLNSERRDLLNREMPRKEPNIKESIKERVIKSFGLIAHTNEKIMS